MNDCSDDVRRENDWESVSISSIRVNALRPLNRKLAATCTNGVWGSFRPCTVSNPLSLDKIRWSPNMVGWWLEPICRPTSDIALVSLSILQLLCISRWSVSPERPPEPPTPPLITSTVADGISFNIVPISRNKSTIFIRTTSKILDRKSRFWAESRLVSASSAPPNSNEPKKTKAVGISSAVIWIRLWSVSVPPRFIQEWYSTDSRDCTERTRSKVLGGYAGLTGKEGSSIFWDVSLVKFFTPIIKPRRFGWPPGNSGSDLEPNIVNVRSISSVVRLPFGIPRNQPLESVTLP